MKEIEIGDRRSDPAPGPWIEGQGHLGAIPRNRDRRAEIDPAHPCRKTGPDDQRVVALPIQISRQPEDLGLHPAWHGEIVRADQTDPDLAHSLSEGQLG